MARDKKTVVLGASPNPSRYSYLAVRKLKNHQYDVVAIGKRKGKIGEVDIHTDHIPVSGVHTVTLYLNPQNQQEYYDYILDMQPDRIIFNPGTENDELEERARAKGIEPVQGCTLVMLGSGMY